MALKLNLGSGGRNIPTWTNIDINPDTKPFPPDLVCDITKLPYTKDSVDKILAIHCLEHIPVKELHQTLIGWRHILKSGGELYISVPDFEAVCKRYIAGECIGNLRGFTNGGQKNQYDIHYSIFDEKQLSGHLHMIGFKNVKRYDWREQEWSYIDSYEQAYLPGFDKGSGQLMSLNLKCVK